MVDQRNLSALQLLRDLQQAVRTFSLGIGRDADSAWERVRTAEIAARAFLLAETQVSMKRVNAQDEREARPT